MEKQHGSRLLAGTAACGIVPMVELGKNMSSKEQQRISADIDPIPHPPVLLQGKEVRRVRREGMNLSLGRRGEGVFILSLFLTLLLCY